MISARHKTNLRFRNEGAAFLLFFRGTVTGEVALLSEPNSSGFVTDEPTELTGRQIQGFVFFVDLPSYTGNVISSGTRCPVQSKPVVVVGY